MSQKCIFICDIIFFLQLYLNPQPRLWLSAIRDTSVRKDHKDQRIIKDQRHKGGTYLIKTVSRIIHLAECLLEGYSKSSNVTIVVLLSRPVDRVDIVQ